MNRIIKKLHMYLGLLNFSILFVFGIAGLAATFEESPENRLERKPAVRTEPFAVPSGQGDKEVADHVYRFLNAPLSSPVPTWAVRRDSDNNLTFAFYTVNGIHKVTVLEKENRLRIEATQNNFWHYLNNLHTTTIGAPSNDWRVRLWKYYNEFAIWSLIGMPLSGIYLGLTSRPQYRLARYALAAGCVLFVLLYVLTR